MFFLLCALLLRQDNQIKIRNMAHESWYKFFNNQNIFWNIQYNFVKRMVTYSFKNDTLIWMSKQKVVLGFSCLSVCLYSAAWVEWTKNLKLEIALFLVEKKCKIVVFCGGVGVSHVTQFLSVVVVFVESFHH